MVEAISDRTCIASKGAFKEDISAEDLLTCCSSCGFGCSGGWPASAWEYWVDHGLVTGGLFNGTGCQPYAIPPHHHGEPYRSTPECHEYCEGSDHSHVTFVKSKHFGKESYSLDGVQAIQADIMKNGPVSATFTVYSDFLSYKSGVYQRHSTESKGGHAIKLIGWGEENGVPYWLGSNSWNREWGENGFFKFLRGTTECGIESDVSAGLPDFKRIG